MLKVPTPACEAVIRMGEILMDKDYSSKGLRTAESLGIAGLKLEELHAYLETGETPSH